MSAAPAQKASVDIARLGKRLYRQVGQALSDFNMIEADLDRWAAHRAFPLIPCTLCGNQENLQRVKIRRMLRDWEREHPGRIDNLFKAMGNVIPSHLADRNLYPFATLQATGVADAGGDRAFDADDECAPPGAVAHLPLRRAT